MSNFSLLLITLKLCLGINYKKMDQKTIKNVFEKMESLLQSYFRLKLSVKSVAMRFS